MAKIISVFNNKGGVGKSTICWNLADSLGEMGKEVLLIDFDPQCNLSIAVLGEDAFVNTLPVQNTPYGTTIRSFMQRFLQNTGGEQVFLHQGIHTSQNVKLVAGDFWLNIYADSLNVGADLLSGTGLSRYVSLRKLVDKAEEANGKPFDYVLIDLPPSFGTLVRAAFYSSDYYIVPCTSDNFSVYCVGLIGQMVPSFVNDWGQGMARFNEANQHFTEFNGLGQPVFAGWIFNGFDTGRRRRTADQITQGVAQGPRLPIQADRTMQQRLIEAIEDDLEGKLTSRINSFVPVANNLPTDSLIGEIEDANVLIQNSIWLSVPMGKLMNHNQVTSLRDRRTWAENQLEQINLIRDKFQELAVNVVNVCI